jgi:hypothetical protein
VRQKISLSAMTYSHELARVMLGTDLPGVCILAGVRIRNRDWLWGESRDFSAPASKRRLSGRNNSRQAFNLGRSRAPARSGSDADVDDVEIPCCARMTALSVKVELGLASGTR